jgi:hypothetical protein
MSRRQINSLIKAVSDRIAPLDVDTLIPMPHKIAAKGQRQTNVSTEERIEYHLRLERFNAHYPDYIAEFFVRPSQQVVDDAWALIQGTISNGLQKSARSAVSHSQDHREKADRGREACASLVILLALLVGEDDAPHNVTYNDCFDALCARFSDHFVRSRARKTRDMAPSTVKSSRRDLLVNYININKLWRFLIREWGRDEANPFYRIQDDHEAKKRRVKTIFIACPKSGQKVDEFRNVVRAADLLHHRGLRLAFVGGDKVEAPPTDSGTASQVRSPPKMRRTTARYCVEVPYNEVKLGEPSKEALLLQADTKLFFDIDAFKKDYKANQKRADVAKSILRKKYNIDATRPNNKPPSDTPYSDDEARYWSPREQDIYYLSVDYGRGETPIIEGIPLTTDDARAAMKLNDNEAEWQSRHERYHQWQAGRTGAAQREPIALEYLVKAAVAAWGWRQRVRRLLSRYDQMNNNRRYHARHMWPTYVSNKDREDTDDAGEDDGERHEDAEPECPSPIEDGPDKSYRKRWFKGRHPKTGQACALVGVDVSSSQTQVIATFLSSAALEQDTMNTEKAIAFKATLARLAFAMHQAKQGGFQLNIGNSSDPEQSYSDADDPKLQNLCKGLWMIKSYGGTAANVVRAQKNDPATYGPGWTIKNASLFFNEVKKKYPTLQLFLSACKYIAQEVVKADRAAGLCLVDPSDGSAVRWNPLMRKDRHLGSAQHKLTVSLPITKELNDDFSATEAYPVDRDALRRMLAPCFVHMLDAYFSTLVMKKLAARGVKDFVAIHDCWLVPEVALDHEGNECSGLQVLTEVIPEASKDWYRGLGPAYLALRPHVKKSTRYRKLIDDAYDHWKQRVAGGYVPPFLVKPD